MKGGNTVICGNMNELKDTMLSKISKAQKDQCHMFLFIEAKEVDLIEVQNRTMVTRGYKEEEDKERLDKAPKYR
jgi:hypothetical protein